VGNTTLGKGAAAKLLKELAATLKKFPMADRRVF
jgi:hypothetical protein